MPKLTLPPFLGLALMAALSLSACGNRLDPTDLEATIKADIERQGRRLSLKEVRCPTNVTRQAGAYFRCVGVLDPEGPFTINVTQQDSQGTVTWDVPNSKVLLNLLKVEASLQQGLSQATGQRAVIDCGSAIYRVNQPGDRFECQVVGGIIDGADAIHSILVKVDSSGNLDWQELRTSTAVAVAPVSGAAQGAAPTGASPTAAGTSAQSRTSPAPAPSPGAVKTSTSSGPTGRPINRPYLPGDND
ncbi:MAG TPA: DUF4333 domain-containing protein [Leptolyngbyaceae cyanobacterium M65_K2018_010]|nr:DUF4333 domain-containing protein [Leptolyngbyaceae cyanobacterium M65_K2018_010]